MSRSLVALIATTLAGCSSLGFGPTPYQAGSYRTDLPYKHGYWESCAEHLRFSNKCSVYFLASTDTADEAGWHMAIYRAAEVGLEQGYPYLSWGLPKRTPVIQPAIAGYYTWGNSIEIGVTYFYSLPPFRSRERAAVGQIYKAIVIVNENRETPSAPVPANAVVKGAEYPTSG